MTKIVLSKKAAANILNVSEEYIELLLKNKELITLTMQEVYEYKGFQDKKQNKALDELVKLTEDYDGYRI